jgi:prepilin-type N-terminal cleavage/methylation domain-containing protein
MRLVSTRGFTLLEILVVIAIFSIGMMIGLPSIMETGRRDQVKAEIRQLKDQIAGARAEAIEQSTPIVVAFAATSYIIDGKKTTLKNSNVNASVTDDEGKKLTSFQWNNRGYPTKVGGEMGDIKEINITISNESDSFKLLISPAGSMTIQHSE